MKQCEAKGIKQQEKVLTVAAGKVASLFAVAEYLEGSAPLEDCNAINVNKLNKKENCFILLLDFYTLKRNIHII